MLKNLQQNQTVQKVSLLAFLLAFVSGAILLVNEFKDPADRSNTLFAQQSGRFAQTSASSGSFNPQPYTPVVTSSNSIGGGDVQGASNGGCEDQNPQGCQSDTIAYQPVCTEINASVDLRGGAAQQNGNTVTVRKNSVIEIWKVTAPLAILSGKEALTDSTYEITKDDPAFRSASHLVDKDLVAAQYFVPGEDRQKLEEIDSASDRGNFSVNVSAGFGSGGGSSASDKATIIKELTSKVEFNPSDPNPGPTNDVTEVIKQSWTVPGDPFVARNYSDPENPSCLMIEPAAVSLPKSDVYETCVDKRSPFDGLIGAVVGAQQWAQCAANEAECEEVELVGLQIDAPFGSNDVCNEGYCADQYFDAVVASGVSPLDIGAMIEPGREDAPETLLKTHFVTTPCKVRIDYKDIYDIPCLWDISPYKAIYDLEASQVQPGDPEFPTWEEYWALVESDSERRGASCSF